MNRADIENLIIEYGKDIFSFCSYITQSRDLAEELYQDTFLAVIKKSDRLEKEKNVKSYILGIAVNLWKNRIKKERRRSYIAPLSDSENEPAALSLPDIAYDIAQKEELDHLMSAVNSLPDKLKIVTMLHYVNNMTTADIADSISIPKGTVLSRLHKARSLLKKEMEKRGY